MSLESLAAILALVAIVAGVFAFFDWLTKRDPAVDESVYDAFALKAKGERGRAEPDLTEMDAPVAAVWPAGPSDEGGRLS